MISLPNIQKRIYEIRNERVMLDMDLAFLYGVETRVLNQAVKRNAKRFPDDFMVRLSAAEWQYVQSQFSDTSIESKSSSQTVMMEFPKNRAGRYLPYAFTEQGVAMLSGILNSDTAINMNIAIMRAFVAIRRLTLQQMDLKEQLREIKERLGEHDMQLNHIYDAMENLLDQRGTQKSWEDRERIGYKI
ncbi:ORF6N domain-containing protein [Mucilaginibacter antarcticus]|uniref:ORF6N domain-containing protein n=2 Tax=Mucilaginibacter antarcticus TaxID=1855725 RepID=A0ABW5XL53_9SPHI